MINMKVEDSDLGYRYLVQLFHLLCSCEPASLRPGKNSKQAPILISWPVFASKTRTASLIKTPPGLRDPCGKAWNAIITPGEAESAHCWPSSGRLAPRGAASSNPVAPPQGAV